MTHGGVNFKDAMSRRGDPGYASAWPQVPGIEVAGIVVQLGDDIVGLAIGEPVVALTNDGGLAEIPVAAAALTVPKGSTSASRPPRPGSGHR